MGIDETKEVLIAANLLTADLITLMKKHAGVVSVAEALLADEALKEALVKAVVGIRQMPSELKDLDTAEMVSLGVTQLQMLPKLMDALKS